jgi:PIN domain nuclease of toxin-antitoxin system
MIVLDTHIWIWWAHGDAHLTEGQVKFLKDYGTDGLGVSVISCWEVAK